MAQCCSSEHYAVYTATKSRVLCLEIRVGRFLLRANSRHCQLSDLLMLDELATMNSHREFNP